MSNLMLAALLAIVAGPQGVTERLSHGGTIVLPPPIEQEIKPYRQCLVEQFDRSNMRASDAETQRRSGAEAVAACTEVRRSAAADANAALEKNRHYRNPEERQASVEKALAALDGGLLPLYLTASPPAPASQLTNEQAAIVYDQCLARAAGKASRSDAPAEAIYEIAETACADTRAMLVVGHDPNSERVQVLNGIDEERAASFPERTRKFREMMQKYQPQTGTPN